VQFGLGAVLPRSNTPSLRVAGFEDENDDEDEYETPHEWRPTGLFSAWRVDSVNHPNTAIVDCINTPATADASDATPEALRSRPRRRRPRILVSGVMEFWSTGVLRTVGIAPRMRGVGTAFRACFWCDLPRAEALGCDL
jgi:hypothetical protein